MARVPRRVTCAFLIALSPAALGVMPTESVLRAQLRGGANQDVFLPPDPAEGDTVVFQTVESLRKDAADGTGAPQIGTDPNYPRTLPAWNSVKSKYPTEAAPYIPCANPLIQATDAIKDAGRLMRGLPQTLARVNEDVRKANELIHTADACVNEVRRRLSGQANNTGGNAPGGRGTVVDRGPVTGGSAGGGTSGGASAGGSGGPSGGPRTPPSGNAPGGSSGGPSASVTKDPCLPFGPGGYDYCANPTQPPGCDCTKRRLAGNASTTAPKCGPDPDWIRQYKAEGKSVNERYGVGFSQAVARCVESQCTISNLAIGAAMAKWEEVRALVAIVQTGNFVATVVSPPGFTPDADPYVRGREEGERICSLVLALPVNPARFPLVGPNGKVSIPRGFNFYKAMGTIESWLPKVNPTQCTRNCGLATINTVRTLFGAMLERVPSTTRGFTDEQMESALGGRFSNAPVAGLDNLRNVLGKMPEGTVGVVSGENAAYGGNTPAAGPMTDESQVPGHFFVFVKVNNQLQFWDGQTGKRLAPFQNPNNWFFRFMVVGNPVSP